MKRLLIPGSLATAAVLAAAGVAGAASQKTTRQQIPLKPTMKQCVAIMQSDYAIVRAIEQRSLACSNSTDPSPFRKISRPRNMLPDAAAECGNTKVELTPWPQCSEKFEAQLCQARGMKNERFKLCTERARQGEAEQRQDQEEQRKRVELLKRYNDAWDRYDKLKQAMSDPFSFAEYVTTKDPAAGQALKADPDTAVEVTRFLKRSTDKTIDAATRNEIVKKIQQEQFDRIFRHFEALNTQVKTLEGMIGRFETTLAPKSAAAAVVPASKRSMGRVRSGCDVLGDANASRELLARNRAEWLALVESCGKPK